ncbi:MAG: hypothetical protein CJBNEKGG_03377 [Prosthecobacter sp.]|nr:hypothetical protein [Prosthecobacter sp.]
MNPSEKDGKDGLLAGRERAGERGGIRACQVLPGCLILTDPMPSDFQSSAAVVIVLVTALAFVWRAVSRAGKQGCGGGCGCDLKPRSKPGVKTPGSP